MTTPDWTPAQVAAYVVAAAGWVETNFGLTLPDRWKATITTVIVVALFVGHMASDLLIRRGRVPLAVATLSAPRAAVDLRDDEDKGPLIHPGES